MKAKINLELLAKQCGVVIRNCDPGFGGRFAYQEEDSMVICGYRTRQAALRGWFMDALSGQLGKMLLRDYLEIEKTSLVEKQPSLTHRAQQRLNRQA